MQVNMNSVVEISHDIHFQVIDESGARYQCIVSREALDDAVGYSGEEGGPDRYSVFINRMEDILFQAKKLIKAGANVQPLVITTQLLNG